MSYSPEDTIAALSTPSGRGAISVIRLSGPESKDILKRIFRTRSGNHFPSDMPPLKLVSGCVYSGEELIDEVMAVHMSSPNSYTGEDMAEIYLHGAPLISSRLLELLYREGARAAEPGEFTQRAFINQKMDLSSAEGVHYLINSHTDKARRAALKLMRGGLKEELELIKEKLLSIRADIDASLEWGDTEDLPDVSAGYSEQIKEIYDKVIHILKSSASPELLNHGLRVVISGRTNAGKSSLFNSLIGRKRSIVSSDPGTTRDIVSSRIMLDGNPFIFSDTAGRALKNPTDADRKALSFLEEEIRYSDIILYVVDSEEGLKDIDLKYINQCEPDRIIVVLNKTDLDSSVETALLPDNIKTLSVSALTGSGLNVLFSNLKSFVKDSGSEELMLGSRQRELLIGVSEYLLSASRQIGESCLELASEDLSRAWSGLGELDGSTLREDIFDLIFSKFCIGK